MSISLDAKRSKIYSEFNDSERYKFFDLTEKKYIHHIDTLYYSVFLKGDCKGNTSCEIMEIIDLLDDFKSQLTLRNDDIWVNYDESIIYKNTRFQFYNHCLSRNNYFDIFICSKLPNDVTPRIVVQLRSIALWTYGVYSSINESFRILKWFLSEYDIEIEKVQENRIDYCYHTNIIQNPIRFYNDNNIRKHLSTTFKVYSKVGRINDNSLTVEYFSLGNRKSNNVFFRSYNKTREVIEMNYKDFFLEFWLNSKLINFYDYYIYTKCYKYNRYDSMYKAMLEFYIEFGKDTSLISSYKSLLLDTKATVECFKRAVTGVLPKPTLILNIEFQTMRKFYSSSNSFIDNLPIISNCEPQLLRLYQILDYRKGYLNYLTSKCVSFVKDKSIPFRNRTECDYQSFWKRLRSVEVEISCTAELKRVYNYKHSIELLEKRIKSSLASISVLKGNLNTDINEDMSYLISMLNDNDIKFCDDGTILTIDEEYNNLKNKKKKALKSIVDSSLSPSKETISS